MSSPSNLTSRCCMLQCHKKVGVLYFECKFCNLRYCAQHQLPETHQCDIKTSGIYDEYRVTNTLQYDSEKKYKHKHLDF